jgi:hypothetical protein
VSDEVLEIVLIADVVLAAVAEVEPLGDGDTVSTGEIESRDVDVRERAADGVKVPDPDGDGDIDSVSVTHPDEEELADMVDEVEVDMHMDGFAEMVADAVALIERVGDEHADTVAVAATDNDRVVEAHCEPELVDVIVPEVVAQIVVVAIADDVPEPLLHAVIEYEGDAKVDEDSFADPEAVTLPELVPQIDGDVVRLTGIPEREAVAVPVCKEDDVADEDRVKKVGGAVSDATFERTVPDAVLEAADGEEAADEERVLTAVAETKLVLVDVVECEAVALLVLDDVAICDSDARDPDADMEDSDENVKEGLDEADTVEVPVDDIDCVGHAELVGVAERELELEAVALGVDD